MNRRSGDGLVIVSIVQKYAALSENVKIWMGSNLRSKITNNVDNEKDCPFFAPHGQVRTPSVAINWVFGSGLDQKIEYCTRRPQDVTGSICGERKDDDDYEKHKGVNLRVSALNGSLNPLGTHPVSQECCLNTPKHGV